MLGIVDEVIKTTEQQYDDYKKRTLKINWGPNAKEINLRTVAQKIINAALSFKDIINAAAAAAKPLHSAYTKAPRWCLEVLVMDGHGSHLTAQFDAICKENKIIPFCMPSHSSHLLQPLDIGCFSAIKKAYGQYIQSKL